MDSHSPSGRLGPPSLVSGAEGVRVGVGVQSVQRVQRQLDESSVEGPLGLPSDQSG